MSRATISPSYIVRVVSSFCSARASAGQGHKAIYYRDNFQRRYLRSRVQTPSSRPVNPAREAPAIEAYPEYGIDPGLDEGDQEIEVLPEDEEKPRFRTSKGLQRISRGEWDERNAQQYTGFNAPAPELVSRFQAELAVHRALAETLYSKQFEGSSDHQQAAIKNHPNTWNLSSATFSKRGSSIRVKLSEGDAVQLDVEDSMDTQASTKVTSPATASSEAMNWRDVRLTDAVLKFAVLKRTSQILGRRVPDPEIDSIEDAADLVRLLSRRPQAMKLAQQVDSDKNLAKLRNLRWGRLTQDDRDREHGSLKVIEEEIRKIRLMTPEQREWVLSA